MAAFGGGGWVLFYKPPETFEIYNDLNNNLVTLFRQVRANSKELILKLTYSLNARVDFQEIKEILWQDVEMPDAERAYRFYQLLQYSYASKGDHFAALPYDIWRRFPAIIGASKRLQSVVIENWDFERLIKYYAQKGKVFVYADPPYYGTESYYQGVNFTRQDHQRLADCLLALEGYFLLSYNDCSKTWAVRPCFQAQSAGEKAIPANPCR